jgi:hypothetical protein
LDRAYWELSARVPVVSYGDPAPVLSIDDVLELARSEYEDVRVAAMYALSNSERERDRSVQELPAIARAESDGDQLRPAKRETSTSLTPYTGEYRLIAQL